MFSSAIMMGAYATMGALGTISNPTDATRMGATVMLTIFGMCLQFSWSPLFHAVVAEVPTQRLRDQTYAVGCIFNILTQWTISFSMPYLLFHPRNLGPQVGYIFLVTSTISLLFAYFCIPECFGKTLEEVDQLFLEQVPIRKFRHARPTLLSNTGLDEKADVEVGVVELREHA
jgi:MFS transporter, SP family, sugar:H+ symporter